MSALLLAPTETAMTAMVCMEPLDCLTQFIKLKNLFCPGQYTYPLTSSHFETLNSY